MLRSGFRSLCVVIATVGFFSSCGGDGGTPAAPNPTTPPPTTSNPVRTVLDTKPFSLAPGTATFKNIDLPPVGVLDATVNWDGGNNVNLYVTDNSCPGFVDLQAGRCPVVARADSPTAKPERLTFSTTAGRIWTFWIHNAGPSAETGSIEVGVTTEGPPPATAPTPSPTTPTDPRTGLAPGPVARFTIKVRTIDRGNFNYRDPEQDDEGRWVVHPGEFVVWDSTQKNAAGELCQWVNDPRWFVTDENGVLSVRGSSQPFLLRADVTKRGEFRITARIDGVDSNELVMLSTR